MTLQEYIQQIAEFAEKETQLIIAELEEKRFDRQGAFNGNPKWQNNDPRVVEDKGKNDPLVDSGNLKKQLTNPNNWDLKPKFSGKKLTLTIDDRENFTDPKYDILDTGGPVSPWKGHKGKIIPPIQEVPARPFKDLSSQDIEWIALQLQIAIRKKFGK